MWALYGFFILSYRQHILSYRQHRADNYPGSVGGPFFLHFVTYRQLIADNCARLIGFSLRWGDFIHQDIVH